MNNTFSQISAVKGCDIRHAGRQASPWISQERGGGESGEGNAAYRVNTVQIVQRHP